MHNRLKTLYKLLEKKQIAALLICNPYNIYYLTGFKNTNPHSRESMLLILSDLAYFILSPLYEYQAKNVEKSLSTYVLSTGENYYQKITHILQKKSVKQLFFECQNMRVAEYNYLVQLDPQLELMPIHGLVESMRIIKDKHEITNIHTACTITDTVLHKLFSQNISTLTEKEIAFSFEVQAQKYHADAVSFSPIIALNSNASTPHHTPSKKTALTSGILLVDCGVEYQSYMSDITRMFLLKNSLSNIKIRTFKKIYQQLKEAQTECIEKIKIGMTGEQAHNLCVNKLKSYKLERYFNHALGHGVGLEIHENPRLSPKSDHVLQENMVFTIEPGVYFPEEFGVRIEDTVLLTKQGCRALTKFSKELLIV